MFQSTSGVDKVNALSLWRKGKSRIACGLRGREKKINQPVASLRFNCGGNF